MAHDKERLSVFRMLKSALKNEAIEKRVPELDDEACLAVIKRMIKQTKDARVDFENAGRRELVLQSDKELAVLEAYMPAQMSEADVAAIVLRHKQALGVTGKNEMGKLMCAVMKDVSGKADGGLVRKLVEKALSVV